MEKLIELLNEYEKVREKSEGTDTDIGLLREWGIKKQGFGNYDNIDRWEGDDYIGGVAIAYLISKNYGFIKWLYENNHIDMREIQSKAEFFCEEYYDEKDDINRILMLLSIQDEPIQFLISILK